PTEQGSIRCIGNGRPAGQRVEDRGAVELSSGLPGPPAALAGQVGAGRAGQPPETCRFMSWNSTRPPAAVASPPSTMKTRVADTERGRPTTASTKPPNASASPEVSAAPAAR